MRTVSMLVAVVALGLAATTPALASGASPRQAPATVSPLGLDDLHLVGAAARTEQGVMLVSTSTRDQAGAAYTSQRASVSAFTATMTFSIQGVCSDGIAMVVQDQGPNALGGGVIGGNIGYGDKGRGSQGIRKSLAFELDAYQNKWDPPVPQLSLQTRGHAQNNPTPQYSLASTSTAPVADGLEHTLVVSYDGSTVQVTYDGTMLTQQPVDLATLLGLSDGTAYIGATAQNAGCTADVNVSAFDVTS